MTMFRASPTLDHTQSALGLLGNLPGTWVGNGFNLIARPDRNHGRPFLLELNVTVETLEFTAIGGSIPNRGSLQDDVTLHAVHYFQRVTNSLDNGALHLEPGLWLHVPATTAPRGKESYVRQASIPHGDSVLAQSTFFTTLLRAPDIQPVDSTPFRGAVPDLHGTSASPITDVSDPGYLDAYKMTPLPVDFLPPALNAAAVVKNPTLVLLAALTGQLIVQTNVISVSTTPVGGIVNIPFVTTNADAVRLDAVFWIEIVKGPGKQTEFLQLQYLQRVILDFSGIHWPHISVATLVKQ
jgi:hypothetical protein